MLTSEVNCILWYTFRTVSGRISSRSSSVTPKIPAKASLHNSADLHNTSASSGSHILDQSSLPRRHGNEVVVDHHDAHSESSVSGSRSLNSPKLEHVQSIEDGTPQHPKGAAMLVTEENNQGDMAIVSQQQQQQKQPQSLEEQGAYCYNFTNILNINTNLDDVEVNESYLNVVGTTNSLSNSSANQNANDNDRSQSHDSYLSEGYEAEIDQTNSISLPSDLKGSSIDQSDSLSLPSDIKVKNIDQSDQSLHSDLSADEVAEIENCLQTITGIGCPDLDSLVENVVEPLLNAAKNNAALAEKLVSDSNNRRSEVKPSERAIVDSEGNVTVGEWVNECKNNVHNEIDAAIDIEVSGQQNFVKDSEIQDGPYSQTSKNSDLPGDIKDSLNEESDTEPSSCILAAVESKLTNDLGINDMQLEDKSNLNGNSNGDDMFEDIPYYLHRRHIVGDLERKKETELYTALINALNHQKEGSSGTKTRRSRSMRRAPNMQIEQLKADEIPFQARSLSLPSKRTSSNSPKRRAPGSLDLDKSEKSRSGRSKMSHSRSSQSRSPSGNRMIEVVNFHTLPRKDNYSSVDDTAASPPEENDLFTHFTKLRSSCQSLKDSRSESLEKHLDNYIVPSPSTDTSADESFGLIHTASESDSLRGLSEASVSLTHSSVSINESETSQGSYSLSDLNLSRDDIVNEMEKMDSFDGDLKTDKIKLEDLDLPFIDDLVESDIAENQLGQLHMTNIIQSGDTGKDKDSGREKDYVVIKEDSITVETMYMESDIDDVGDNSIEEHESKQCLYSDVVVTDGIPKFNDSGSQVTNDTLQGYNFALDEVETFKNVKSPRLKNSSRPVLKPLEIPPKTSWKKTKADDEWESLLQQLKDDEDNSPDDLNPADLLLSLSDARTKTFSSPKVRRPLSVEESEIEELDRLLLETTKFNGHPPQETDEYARCSGYSAGATYLTRRHFNQTDINFSTFKPTESPVKSSSTKKTGKDKRCDVVTVSLSHDAEDIQMEDKSICAFIYHKEEECRQSSSSLSSPRHAIIRRSPSPSRLLEYSSKGHREFTVKGDGGDQEISKSHSYHGETSESIDASAKRKRMEPKRVSFHETVEEITTEAYHTSSSSSDDKNIGDKDSDVGTPDSLDTGTASDLNYDPDVSSFGDGSSQNVPDDSAAEAYESDMCRTEDNDDSDDEEESSDEEDEVYSDRDEEFLKFAQRLSECGKDGAADSGIGDSMTNTTEVSPSEPISRLEKHVEVNEPLSEDENNIVNGNSGIHVGLDKQSLQSFEGDSSSSDSDQTPAKKDKRPSIDPLESLEQLHDSYVSSSEESCEGETTAKVNCSDE